MKIGIFGFNIFAKGGTSRSNINLIHSMLEEGHQVVYFNYQPFDETAYTELIIHENIQSDHFTIRPFKDEDEHEMAYVDYLIITRESFFKYAQNVKHFNPHVTIVGEIHGPLSYLPQDFSTDLQHIDAVRVSTLSIQQKFQAMFDYPYVFPLYVNTRHIAIDNVPSNTRRNLLIKSRFEDNVKDISYVIRLINYIVKNQSHVDIHLYLIGYGPSMILYKNLVRYYQLEDYIHINGKQPRNYIYMSTSPYETLGFSILEALGEGNKALIYQGDDKVLKEIYEPFHGIEFLTKNLLEDADILLQFLNRKYTREMRDDDVKILQQSFLIPHYASLFLSKVDTCVAARPCQKRLRRVKKRRFTDNKQKYTELYLKFNDKLLFRKILNNPRFKAHIKNIYYKRTEKLQNNIEPLDTHVFVESFHGNNFSGDPKYIALSLKEHYPEMQIFVSSKNALVDMEIRSFGLTPVRFGSQAYIEAFKSSKYVFVNGNTWDKVGKHPQQIFVQTWHGFPLKKMVGNLNNPQERAKQLNAFLPRMMKWDYLLTSSHINTMLFKSAFKLDQNHHLQVLTDGAPRNSYLMHHHNATERQKIQFKYFQHQDKDKQYVLFCPTWRQEKRDCVSNINLKKLLEHLPEHIHIIVKLHPNEGHLRNHYNTLDQRIHCFYNELVDIQELYIISDWMITDYSSTIFDYAHLNKPIFLLHEDQMDYNQNIGFNFNIHQLGYFPIASHNEEKLAQQIKNTTHIDYTHMIQRLMAYDHEKSDIKVLENIIRSTKEDTLRQKKNLLLSLT